MVAAVQLQTALENVLGELQEARRNGDLGRLAAVSFCDLKRWARMAHDELLAQQSLELVLNCPHRSREAFLNEADTLIRDAERALQTLRQHEGETQACGT